MDQHLTEEQLILRYYGEAASDDDADRHLAGCSVCRDDYRRLQVVLNSVESPVPERAANYEAQVWAKIAPAIPKPRRWLSRFHRGRWLPIAAMAGLVVAAFLAGRYTQPPQPQTASAPQVRERILVVAVGDHLETSQMVLAEIVNSARTDDAVDFSTERQLAESLVNANRLYRQTAAAEGDTGVASVLDDLERVLIEVAHSPDTLSAAQLDTLRQRIEAQGLLFKIRVIGSQMREQSERPMPQSKETKL
jgi:hypothetical protein